MGRKRNELKKEEHNNFFEKPIVAIPIPQEELQPAIAANAITLNHYLTNHSQKRSLDVVFSNWFKRKDPLNPYKTVEEWDALISQFLNEIA